ncbi:MAG: RNA polymerase sigma factor [Proteobacteria bacterium]|nr:RNA polymerase sigma factor [Pseudomonadota bacterium]
MAAGAAAGDAVTAVTEQGLADELEWVERARQADTSAFESLYRLHVDKIYGLCLRMTGNASEAEDCTQDAFIQAWRKLAKFRGDSAFSSWLHRIAVNAVLVRMRKSRREQDRIQAVTDISPAAKTVGDSGNLEDLQKAVDELPAGARRVFVLHAVYGYSHDETSSMLGIAVGTSKAQLHRAKRLLAQQLKQNGYES